MPRTLGVAVLGYAGIAPAHINALHRCGETFSDLPAIPRLVAVAGRTSHAVAAAAHRFGAARWTTDWETLIDDPEIDVLINAGPNDIHAAPSIAALRAGKGVLCEKPLGRTAAEADAMARAALDTGETAMTGFNYRFVPAILLARRLLGDGGFGRIYHFRGRYSDDTLLDPEAPYGWRRDRDAAGSGVIADIASHVIDLAHFLVGRIAAVSAASRTYTPTRPFGDTRRSVTVEDAVVATVEFHNGAIGTLEASGLCPGRKNLLSFEINGERGTLVFDLERLNELRVYHGEGAARGLTDVLVTDQDHPYGGRWWPPGHILGWEHAFVHQFEELIRRVTGAGGEMVGATFADGLASARICDALLASVETGRRIPLA